MISFFTLMFGIMYLTQYINGIAPLDIKYHKRDKQTKMIVMSVNNVKYYSSGGALWYDRSGIGAKRCIDKALRNHFSRLKIKWEIDKIEE